MSPTTQPPDATTSSTWCTSTQAAYLQRRCIPPKKVHTSTHIRESLAAYLQRRCIPPPTLAQQETLECIAPPTSPRQHPLACAPMPGQPGRRDVAEDAKGGHHDWFLHAAPDGRLAELVRLGGAMGIVAPIASPVPPLALPLTHSQVLYHTSQPSY